MPYLRAGDIVRYANKSLWLVTRSNSCSASLTAITGVKATIVTRKGETREIWRRPSDHHIAPNASVEVLHPDSLLARWAKEKYRMSTTETTPTTGEAPKVRKARTLQTYVRTEKERPAKLTGQGQQVLDKIEELGGQVNANELTEALKGQFKTRQPDERIVGFYLAKFKRQGILQAVGAADAGEAEAADEAPSEEFADAE